MTKTSPKIRFDARLLRPAEPSKSGSWFFLILPKSASAKLPSRGMTSVEGTINGHPFRATLEPDGQKSHWLKVTSKMREAAGVEVGDMVELEIAQAEKEPEPRVPADLRKALDASPKVQDLWSKLTPVARRDWVQWVASAKLPETRARRIESTGDRLLSGKRAICCFDRSGFYSKGCAAPKAAD